MMAKPKQSPRKQKPPAKSLQGMQLGRRAPGKQPGPRQAPADAGAGQTTGAVTVVLEPRDPLVVRDARPFGADAGARAVTLSWPMPRTIAGALRSHVGSTARNPLDWGQQADRDKAVAMPVAGPLLLARNHHDAPWTVYFPAPRDAVLYYDDDGQQTFFGRRPRQPVASPECATEGTTPLRPEYAGLPLMTNKEVKASGALGYWSLRETVDWLAAEDGPAWEQGRQTKPPPERKWPQDRLPPLLQETRTHVAINSETETARDGALFTSVGLRFHDEPVTPWERSPRFAATATPLPQADEAVPPHATAMLCRVTPAGVRWGPKAAYLWLGGERRVSSITPAAGAVEWPMPPPELMTALTGKTLIRLQLVTPALFTNGWLPRWLTSDEKPPALAGVTIKRLAGAIVERRLGISGWDMANHEEQAVRFAVPAGCVYFLELTTPLSGDAARALWLGSVCDEAQDRRDGFGLVLPGVWKWEKAS